jgi:hypothetical protein
MSDSETKQSNNSGSKGIAIGHGSSATNSEKMFGSTDTKELTTLIDSLYAQLEAVPEKSQQDAQAIKSMAENLKSASEKDTSPNILKVQAEGLKAAAETLKEIAPTVLTIASQIVTHILRMT